jgi:hypothetical protein
MLYYNLHMTDWLKCGMHAFFANFSDAKRNDSMRFALEAEIESAKKAEFPHCCSWWLVRK